MRPIVPFAALALVVVPALAPPAEAQGQGSNRRVSLTLKGGVNRESAEDGLRGSAGAAGAAIDFPLGGAWTGEMEIWIPGRFRHGGQEHRDIPVSATLTRSFGGGGVRPFMLGGVSFARTETTLTSCIADRPRLAIVSCDSPDVSRTVRETHRSATIYMLVGTGMEVPLTRRMVLIPEVRVNLAVTSILLRPAVGVRMSF